ncbi:helix-turn-helix transcriptional regulator [Streptomyces sp. ME19-01-6]|uniref:helix-turn-helix domain-containing protein n=1 Tax=Streptomyces sp. ME19-01-6 TaxID=3028686 RepID=UPI0029A71688|nr:helix-turn-helix transcriptional regulator [Streptomyces sp. ME19-01-6]MDX3225814.1 helix-turn-helix transcriptional regulator [Streptomyces sp. ME19-01-6]
MGLRVNPTYRQRRFGAELRKVRERAGMSVADAAALLGMRQPQLSKIEAGRTGMSPERVRALARAAGDIHDAYVDVLEDMAQDPGKGWWSRYRGVLGPSHLDLAELEADAVGLWNYEPMYVPGLLQTAGYATAIHGGSYVENPQAVRDQAVEFRMERQKVLVGECAPHIHAIVHESALRVHWGGRTVMRDQLLHLIEVSRLPNVTIQVFPLDTERGVAFNHAFMVIEPNVTELSTVSVDQLGMSEYLGDQEVVGGYRDTFGKLAELALPQVDAASAPEARRAKDSLGLIQHILYPLL